MRGRKRRDVREGKKKLEDIGVDVTEQAEREKLLGGKARKEKELEDPKV